jgi:hypothetical protein
MKKVKCVSCGKETAKPFCNGDNKNRCESCAVTEYKSKCLGKLLELMGIERNG